MTARAVAFCREPSAGDLDNGRTDIDVMIVTAILVDDVECPGCLGWRAIPLVLHNPSSIMTIRGSIYQARNPDAVPMFLFVDIPALPGGMETSGPPRL